MAPVVSPQKGEPTSQTEGRHKEALPGVTCLPLDEASSVGRPGGAGGGGGVPGSVQGRCRVAVSRRTAKTADCPLSAQLLPITVFPSPFARDSLHPLLPLTALPR